AFDLDVVDRNRLGSRQGERFAGSEIESAPVSRAFHLGAEHFAFRERGFRVTAAVTDGIDVVADPKQGDAVLADVDAQASPGGNPLGLYDLDPAHPNRPSSWASTKREKTASSIGA